MYTSRAKPSKGPGVVTSAQCRSPSSFSGHLLTEIS